MYSKDLYRNLWLFLLCFLELVGCSSLEMPSPVQFDEDLMNRQILLRSPEFYNTFKTTSPITIEIKNTTSYKIVFPNDYNIKIYSKVGDDWKEVKEIPTIRLPEGDNELFPASDLPTLENIFVSPDLPDYSLSYHLRVYVFGDLIKDNEVVKVAAYTDVLLVP